MRSGRFMQELNQRQDIYMAYRMDGEEISEEKFSVQSVQFSLQVNEETYIREYFRNEDFRGLLYGISTALGVGIHCSFSKIAVVVTFPGKGFWCCKSFYGEMLKMVEGRLRFLMGGSVPINRKEKPKDISMVIVDDMDS